MDEYINIGKLVAAFGLTGELILKHALGKKTAFKEADAIFIEEHKTSHLPYFIKSSKAKNQEETLIQLEGVDTREKAKRFVQKKVWLRATDFRKFVAKKSPLELLGYKVINNEKELSIIEEVIEQPHQVLLRILINDKEALIPLHDETLINIDHKKKEVYVTLPDGLLDVYL
jgi:16S rRNA processing protein RimM